MIRVGLIGFGLAGRWFHAPLIAAAGMQIQAVVTSRTQEVRTALPDADALGSPDHLYSRNDIDLIVVASPNHLHVEQATAALESGKHVVVDKPVSASAAEARELSALAARVDRRLAAFHNRRWDSDFLTIQKLIREARLGPIQLFSARWDRYRPTVSERWREKPHPGVGLTYDLGVHLVDQALCLFGEPDWVQADVWSQREGSLIDDAFEILLGKAALRISLSASSIAADPDWRYRINGSRAAYVKAGFDPQEPQARAGMSAADASFGVEAEAQWGRLTEGATGRSEIVPSERGHWTSFYEIMRRSIEEGGPVPVTVDEAALAIEIIEAAFQSSREGRRIWLPR